MEPNNVGLEKHVHFQSSAFQVPWVRFWEDLAIESLSGRRICATLIVGNRTVEPQTIRNHMLLMSAKRQHQTHLDANPPPI